MTASFHSVARQPFCQDMLNKLSKRVQSNGNLCCITRYTMPFSLGAVFFFFAKALVSSLVLKGLSVVGSGVSGI